MDWELPHRQAVDDTFSFNTSPFPLFAISDMPSFTDHQQAQVDASGTLQSKPQEFTRPSVQQTFDFLAQPLIVHNVPAATVHQASAPSGFFPESSFASSDPQLAPPTTLINHDQLRAYRGITTKPVVRTVSSSGSTSQVTFMMDNGDAGHARSAFIIPAMETAPNSNAYGLATNEAFQMPQSIIFHPTPLNSEVSGHAVESKCLPSLG